MTERRYINRLTPDSDALSILNKEIQTGSYRTIIGRIPGITALTAALTAPIYKLGSTARITLPENSMVVGGMIVARSIPTCGEASAWMTLGPTSSTLTGFFSALFTNAFTTSAIGSYAALTCTGTSCVFITADSNPHYVINPDSAPITCTNGWWVAIQYIDFNV